MKAITSLLPDSDTEQPPDSEAPEDGAAQAGKLVPPASQPPASLDAEAEAQTATEGGAGAGSAAGPHLITFGCRLNSYESALIRGLAQEAGLADETVIVNTCAVTSEAERQARQAIRRARRDHPNARIIVTGCAAQIDPARYGAMPEIDQVLGNREKLSPVALRAEPAQHPSLVSDLFATDRTGEQPPTGEQPAPARRQDRTETENLIDEETLLAPMLEGIEGRSRAHLQVQGGCDHRCTFCIIPYSRGPNCSEPLDRLVPRLQRLVDGGFREVVLTGVDLCSYGTDLPDQPRLGTLVEALLAAVPELPRLRLSSLDPAAIDETLLALIADEPRLMPFLHLSLQAGDDLILKRMGRRHNRAQVLALCHSLRERRPGIGLGADIIAGFPTETEAQFRNSLDLVAAAELAHLHVFAFSPRPGTPAARMPSLPGPVIRDRARRLREQGEALLARDLDRRIGLTGTIVVEKHTPDGLTGHDESFAQVRVPRAALTGRLPGDGAPAPVGAAPAEASIRSAWPASGSVLRVLYGGREGGWLIGRPVP